MASNDAIGRAITAVEAGRGMLDVSDVVYAWFQDGASMPALIEAVRGLTDGIHRNPAVHGDAATERLCTELYNDLTKAMESARLLEEAIDKQLRSEYL